MLASLGMQHCGVPKSAIKCLFTQLQTSTHQVRTSYGDSANSYGGKTWISVPHRIGQGKGAGPAIWVVFSTPLLHILCSRGLHCQFIDPFSTKSTCFSGFSFVDDTDLIIANIEGGDYQSVLTSLQESVDTWEGCLKATCRAILPEKSFCFLVNFTWQSVTFKYKSLKDCPGELFVNDLQRIRSKLRRYEPPEAQQTQDVSLAPDGNLSTQFKKCLV